MARADKGCQLLSLASLRSHWGLGSKALSQLRVNPVGWNEPCLIELSSIHRGASKASGSAHPQHRPSPPEQGPWGVGGLE